MDGQFEGVAEGQIGPFRECRTIGDRFKLECRLRHYVECGTSREDKDSENLVRHLHQCGAVPTHFH